MARATGQDVDCSIVIVHYRAEEKIVNCLARLPQGAAGLSYETIVIDNSRTLAASGVAQRFSNVHFVESERNVGFAGAANRGIALATGRNILLLNPDAVTHAGSVTALAHYLDAHPEAGVVGPRMIDPDGRLQYSCRRFPEHLTIFFGRYAMLTRLWPRNPYSRRYLYLDWDHSDEREVDWLSGACLMTRRSVVQTIGELDERFFLFVEDMDWCRRIRDGGYRVVYLPDAVVTHEVGVSRESRSPMVIWARHRGMWLFYRKHFRRRIYLLPLVACGLALRAAMLILATRLRPVR